jgi:hypothetical protein
VLAARHCSRLAHHETFKVDASAVDALVRDRIDPPTGRKRLGAPGLRRNRSRFRPTALGDPDGARE